MRLAIPALLLLSACLPQAETAAPAPDDAPRPVQVAEIRYLPADSGQSFTGVIRARREADVALRAGGRITERLVDLGAEVTEGQPLFRLDPRDLDLALRAAEAEVLSAEATASQAGNDAARSRALVSAGHVAAAFHEQREATARAATQRLAAARAQRDLARNRLDYAVLRAPSPGRVTAIMAEAGQVIAEGTPVLRLADPSEREILVQLPENAITITRATARFWARPAAALPVHLREVAAQSDPTMRTYAARFSLPDAPDWARLGMTATISLGAEPGAPMARIPLAALHDRGRGPMVWRLEASGHLAAEPVTVTALSESQATIRTTLAEGTRIIAMGAQLLAPDSRVRAVEARLAASLN